MTYQEILRNGESQLQMAGITEAKTNAWHLFEHAFSMNLVDYFLHQNEPFHNTAKKRELSIYQKLLEKRAEHIPLQHLLGVQEFMGLPFFVNEHVLIPRQDTETLVEIVLKDQHLLKQRPDQGREQRLGQRPEQWPDQVQEQQLVQRPTGEIKLLDMCTGSGCIALSLAKLSEVKIYVTMADISPDALDVAIENSRRLEVSDVNFIETDMFQNIHETDFTIITANPPYIPTVMVDTLMEEVRKYEPHTALDGKQDGLYFYRILAEQCRYHLCPGGWVYLEIGHDQGEPVKNLMEEYGYGFVTVLKDITGHDRVIKARRSSNV